MSKDSKLQASVDAKIARRDALIPEAWRLRAPGPPNGSDVTRVTAECGILSTEELDIVAFRDPTALRQAIQTKRWSIRQVTEAFCKSAAIAHQLTNCLTEIIFEGAVERAAELDAELAKGGVQKGPLFGLPVSLKDSVGIKGVDSSVGYVTWIDRPKDETSLLADILLDAGAILYCKTNVPQTMMTAETINNVFGTTTNPHNTNLTPGGSTGGEGALIALRGSMMGFGSVRMPATCCGIYALKPSTGRLPTMGCSTSVPGQESIPPNFGVMASTVEGLELLMSTVAAAKPWELDVRCIPSPWTLPLRDEVRLRPVRFGLMKTDGRVRPHPPIENGLELVKRKLLAAGHEVVEWPAFDYAPLQDMTVTAFCADGCVKYRKIVEEGQEDLVGPILLGKDNILGKANPELSVAQLWDLHAQRNAYTIAHNRNWLATSSLTDDGLPVDCILCPAAPHAAPLHGTYDYLGYTNFANLLDYPASVFPVPGLRVEPEPSFDKKAHLSSHKPANPLDALNWSRYDPNATQNAPICYQIVTRRLEEEKNIGILSRVVEALAS